MSDTPGFSKRDYMELMKRFLLSEIDGRTFQTTFLDMWRSDRDASYARVQTWPKRYDIELMDARLRGDLNPEEFSVRWQKLWGYEPTRWLEIQDALFRDVDRFEPDPVLYEESKQDPVRQNADYCITEAELRERVKTYILELESEQNP
jgi:hypothetical protein